MILYIAGPMTGYPDLNYPAFLAAEAQLQAAGFETRNPVDAEQDNETGEQKSWSWYMRHALRMVTEADGVALLPGWDKSRGAILERHVAYQLELSVRELAQWLS